MRKASAAAAVLAGLLAVTVVPVLGADQSQTPPDQTKPTETAKPADSTTAAQPAQPAEPKKEEPKKEEPKKPNPNALTKNTYGGGFRLGSENGRFLIRFFGAAQFRYTYLTYDDQVNGNSTDYSNFFMRRARLWWDGHAYSPKFTYYFHLQMEPGSAVNLHDAWINYAFHPMFQVGTGRNKIAYGLEFVNSGFGNNFVDRSIFSGETDISGGGGLSRWPGGGTEGFNVSTDDASTGFPTAGLILFRSQGLQISGKSGEKGPVFEYQAGVWNGRNTKGASNPDAGHLYSIRAGFHPNGFVNWLFAGDPADTQRLMTGFLVSAYHDSSLRRANYAGAAVPAYDSKGYGVDLAFMLRYRGFSTDLEWANENYKLEDSTLVGTNDFDRAGWRAQLGYFVKPRLVEVVGRYAENQRVKDATPIAVRNSGLGFAKVRNANGVMQDAVEKNLREMTFGVNWYLSGAQHQHKFFVDYSRLTREFEGFASGTQIVGAAPDQQDNRVRAMLQFKF
jgi:hypothetical protein